MTYRILNAVQNKTLNSRVFKIVRESAVPISAQEISNLLEIRLAKVHQRIDSLFGQGQEPDAAAPNRVLDKGSGAVKH